MLQAAEYDAVVSITHTAPPYKAAVPAPAGARPDAAADQAAHDVLLALYPAARADLDAQLRDELAAVPDGRPSRRGSRSVPRPRSGSSTCARPTGRRQPPHPFVAGTEPGDYRPTPPKNAAPMYTTWGAVTPFVLDGAQRFRPAAPPAVTSPAYTAALAEVRDLGRDSSTTRTPDQTAAGKFWSSAPVWNTWNQIAQQVATDRHASLTQASAAFSALDLALADTTIAMYDAKYADHVWRPVTAIQRRRPELEPAHPHRRRPVLPRRAQCVERRGGDRADRLLRPRRRR